MSYHNPEPPEANLILAIIAGLLATYILYSLLSAGPFA